MTSYLKLNVCVYIYIYIKYIHASKERERVLHQLKLYCREELISEFTYPIIKQETAVPKKA